MRLDRRHVSAILVVMTLLALTGCTGAAAPKGASQPAEPSAAAPSAPAAEPVADTGGDAAKLVTVDDIEKVTGLSGVKVVEKGSVSGANGDQNFAGSDGVFLLWVNVKGADYYDTMVQGGMTEQVEGIGDAAFIGPKQAPKQVMFKKGGAAVLINAKVVVKNGKPVSAVEIEKLEELAKLAASRL